MSGFRRQNKKMLATKQVSFHNKSESHILVPPFFVKQAKISLHDFLHFVSLRQKRARLEKTLFVCFLSLFLLLFASHLIIIVRSYRHRRRKWEGERLFEALLLRGGKAIQTTRKNIVVVWIVVVFFLAYFQHKETKFLLFFSQEEERTKKKKSKKIEEKWRCRHNLLTRA